MTQSAFEVPSQPAIPNAGPTNTAAPSLCPVRGASSLLLRFLQSAAFAYAMILLLQLKVVWRAWDLRDLTSGDTSGYYVRAFTWYQDWLVNIVWSPLYLAFYGTLMHLTQDVFAVTTLHRLVIVFTATAGVLAVLRRMLPHWLALLVAAWWAVLPINFDTLYEVHLFALLPVLVAWLVIMRRPPTAAGGEWRRSIALAILVLSTFLVRNEMVVAVGCLGLICIVWECRNLALKFRSSVTPGRSGAGDLKDTGAPSPAPPRIPSSPANPGQRRANLAEVLLSLLLTLLRYALPTLLVLLLVLGAYFRSFVRYGGYVLHGQPQPDLREVARIKHTLNMAQVYAFGYQQRHPEWDKSPWTECGELSRQTFGRPDPTITDMLVHNPRATLEHFAWNFRLAPAGLQVLLFNATSFHDDPDYAPVNIDPDMAVPLSLSALALVFVGLVVLVVRWRYWWDYWLRDRAWGWAAMLAVAVTVLFIIPTQRPRPSYLFSFSVLLMTIVGMSLFIILHTVAGLFGLRQAPGKHARAWVPATAALLLAGILVGVLQIIHLSQHPRPHYFLHLSPLTVLLAGRALAGVCAFLLILALAGLVKSCSRSGSFAPVLPFFAAACLAALIYLVPSYYVAQAAENQPESQRKVLRTYLALRPYQSYIQRKDTVFLKGAYGIEVQYYLGMADPVVLDYSVLDEMKSDEKLATLLDHKNVNLFFLDNERWSQLEAERPGIVQELIDHGNADGWRLVGFADEPTSAGATYQYLTRWLLFRKAAPDGSGGFDASPAGLSAGRGNGAFAGWRESAGLGPIEGPYPLQGLPLICWGYGPATRLTIPPPGDPAQGGKYKLVFSGMCWIPNETVIVKLDGVVQGSPHNFQPAGTWVDVTVPLELTPGPHDLVLEYSKWESPPTSPLVKLAVKFKKLQVLPD